MSSVKKELNPRHPAYKASLLLLYYIFQSAVSGMIGRIRHLFHFNSNKFFATTPESRKKKKRYQLENKVNRFELYERGVSI